MIQLNREHLYHVLDNASFSARHGENLAPSTDRRRAVFNSLTQGYVTSAVVSSRPIIWTRRPVKYCSLIIRLASDMFPDMISGQGRHLSLVGEAKLTLR